MTCTTCGVAAPHLAQTALCPSCQLRAHKSDPNVTVMWPPPPARAPLGPPPVNIGAVQEQRQLGIVMDVGAMVAVQAAFSAAHFLLAPYGSILTIVVVVGAIYPHFRGSAHWAESKGYPRSTGRIIGMTSWLGPLILALLPEKPRKTA